MADSQEAREYLHEFVLHCLHVAGQPSSAGDLVEHIGVLALSEGHPKIIGLSTQTVAGYLRALENAGKVKRGDGKYQPRHGRHEATWLPTRPIDPKYPIPHPPDPDAAVTPAQTQRARINDIAPSSPYDHLTKEQLLAVLQIQDDISAAAARFLEEVERIKKTAHARLVVMGVR